MVLGGEGGGRRGSSGGCVEPVGGCGGSTSGGSSGCGGGSTGGGSSGCDGGSVGGGSSGCSGGSTGGGSSGCCGGSAGGCGGCDHGGEGGGAGGSKGAGPIAHHIAATSTAKTPRPPSSQRIPLRFWVGADAGEVEDAGEGGVVLPDPGVFCVSESDERNGEPQRGQDLLFHVPRLEPQEVQYMFFCRILSANGLCAIRSWKR